MNAVLKPVPRLSIVHLNAYVTVVNVWGFDMQCEYEFDAGEPRIDSPIEDAHPGTPANAELIGCRVGGVQIVEMLTLEQRERIEEKILEQLEDQ